MTKKLLLFLQSNNTGLYVNIITHCVQFEGVNDIYFAVNSGEVGKLSEAKDKIRKIRNKLETLSSEHQDQYQRPYDIVPSMTQLEERIIKVSFTNPASSILELKKKFNHPDRIIIDISGCNKKVSMDTISSYISNGIKHICCFELDDIVYSPEWKDEGLSKDYHDIYRDIAYYEYIDFSKAGTTIESFNRMRSQGKLVRFLFIISVVLGVMVFVLIQKQQNIFAQYAAISLALITGLGLVNDIFGVVDRLK